MATTRPNRLVPVFAASVLVVLLGASSVLFGLCGPFTDVAADSFCPFVLEIFYLGITTGTTPTTYDPTSSVSRLQMAAFLSRSVDRVLQRGSRRAALNQYWTTQAPANLGLTTLSNHPYLLQSDGADLWVAKIDDTVSRVRASDGKVLETWTGASGAYGVLVAMGKVFVSGGAPGKLYRIEPSQPAAAVSTVASNLGSGPLGLTFDGSRIWTANGGGSVSIVTPTVSIPWTVTTVATGFTEPFGALYDGSNVWVTDAVAGKLQKLDGNGAILQTATLGVFPELPAFDGTNIWVPNNGSASVSVVRASTGAVLATLTGNGLTAPFSAAFDGQRVMVTNNGVGASVSLWKAADLAAIGSFSTGGGTNPYGSCSDGTNFWIGLNGADQLARF